MAIGTQRGHIFWVVSAPVSYRSDMMNLEVRIAFASDKRCGLSTALTNTLGSNQGIFFYELATVSGYH